MIIKYKKTCKQREGEDRWLKTARNNEFTKRSKGKTTFWKEDFEVSIGIMLSNL
jgi:hypothetical protein